MFEIIITIISMIILGIIWSPWAIVIPPVFFFLVAAGMSSTIHEPEGIDPEDMETESKR